MKRILFTFFICVFSIAAVAQVRIIFKEQSPLPEVMQNYIKDEIEIRCPDAYKYQWTMTESITNFSVIENGSDIKTNFNSEFLVISATMDPLSVTSEMHYDYEADKWTNKVHSINGKCND